MSWVSLVSTPYVLPPGLRNSFNMCWNGFSFSMWSCLVFITMYYRCSWICLLSAAIFLFLACFFAFFFVSLSIRRSLPFFEQNVPMLSCYRTYWCYLPFYFPPSLGTVFFLQMLTQRRLARIFFFCRWVHGVPVYYVDCPDGSVGRALGF